MMIASSCEAAPSTEITTTIMTTQMVHTEELTPTPLPVESTSNKEVPSDVLWEEGFTPEQGRIYRDASYYCEVDGNSYIAVNTLSEQAFVLDSSDTLHVGDTLRIDRDLSVQIDSVDKDSKWEDPYCPESGLVMQDASFYRNKGKIVVNRDYYFVHPARTVWADGTVEMQAGVDDPNVWLLGYRDKEAPESVSIVSLHDSCKWVKTSNDCIVTFVVNDEESQAQSIDDIFSMMDKYSKNALQSYFDASFTYRNGELVKITIVE